MNTMRQQTIIPLAIAGKAPNSDPTASFSPWFLLITLSGLKARTDLRTLKLFRVCWFNVAASLFPLYKRIKSQPIQTKKSIWLEPLLMYPLR